MELHAEERAVARFRDEAVRPGGRGRCLDRVRVREVVGGAVDLRPADARHALGLDAHGPARQEPETVDAAVLLRPVDRELQAEADAEYRTLVSEPLAQRRVEPLRA